MIYTDSEDLKYDFKSVMSRFQAELDKTESFIERAKQEKDFLDKDDHERLINCAIDEAEKLKAYMSKFENWEYVWRDASSNYYDTDINIYANTTNKKFYLYDDFDSKYIELTTDEIESIVKESVSFQRFNDDWKNNRYKFGQQVIDNYSKATKFEKAKIDIVQTYYNHNVVGEKDFWRKAFSKIEDYYPNKTSTLGKVKISDSLIF